MNPIKTRVLDSALKSKGFRIEDRDHKFYFLQSKGEDTHIRTKISHGKPEYDAYLLSIMAKELHLTNKQFGEFIECSISHEKYMQILIKNGDLKKH